MFDIASWKLLLLAAIALIVVGPKDLPVMLRTIGRYLGIIKRQAAEFRAQFDEAIRESELAEVKKEFENLGKETEKTLKEAEASVNAEIDGIKSEVDQVAADINRPIERLEGGGTSDTPELTAETAVALNASGAADAPVTLPPADGHVNGSAAHEVAVPTDVAQPQAPAIAVAPVAVEQPLPPAPAIAKPAAKVAERVEA